MSRYYSTDPIADFNRKDRDDQKWLDSRPRCYYCGEPIQEDVCYMVNGHKYHTDWDECKDAAAEAILPQLLQSTTL